MARQRWNIHVTEDDLNRGEMRDSNRCAVKRAVTREVPGAKRVEVDLQTIRFSLDGERYVYLTPWQVAEYVIAFDAGENDLDPFAFQLRSAVELGAEVRRHEFTEEGKKVDAARSRLRKARTRKAQLAEVLADPTLSAEKLDTTSAKIAEVDVLIAGREKEYEAARNEAKVVGRPLTKRVDKDKPKAPRRSKTRTRRYGMRVLRVNQAKGRMHVT